MGYHALVTRDGDGVVLSTPTIICRSWHPTEDPDLAGDDDELAIELELHERGYRMCQCYSPLEPDGEFGHIAEGRLLEITQHDFEEAVGLLQDNGLPEYEERRPQRGCARAQSRVAHSVTTGRLSRLHRQR